MLEKRCMKFHPHRFGGASWATRADGRTTFQLPSYSLLVSTLPFDPCRQPLSLIDCMYNYCSQLYFSGPFLYKRGCIGKQFFACYMSSNLWFDKLGNVRKVKIYLNIALMFSFLLYLHNVDLCSICIISIIFFCVKMFRRVTETPD